MRSNNKEPNHQDLIVPIRTAKQQTNKLSRQLLPTKESRLLTSHNIFILPLPSVAESNAFTVSAVEYYITALWSYRSNMCPQWQCRRVACACKPMSCKASLLCSSGSRDGEHCSSRAASTKATAKNEISKFKSNYNFRKNSPSLPYKNR